MDLGVLGGPGFNHQGIARDVLVLGKHAESPEN